MREKLAIARPMAVIDKAPNGSQLIIIGGVDPQSNKRKTSEIYDLRNATFRMISSMITERAACGICSFHVQKSERGKFPWDDATVIEESKREISTDESNSMSQPFVYCTRDPRCPKRNRHSGRCKIGRSAASFQFSSSTFKSPTFKATIGPET